MLWLHFQYLTCTVPQNALIKWLTFYCFFYVASWDKTLLLNLHVIPKPSLIPFPEGVVGCWWDSYQIPVATLRQSCKFQRHIPEIIILAAPAFYDLHCSITSYICSSTVSFPALYHTISCHSCETDLEQWHSWKSYECIKGPHTAFSLKPWNPAVRFKDCGNGCAKTGPLTTPTNLLPFWRLRDYALLCIT